MDKNAARYLEVGYSKLKISISVIRDLISQSLLPLSPVSRKEPKEHCEKPLRK